MMKPIPPVPEEVRHGTREALLLGGLSGLLAGLMLAVVAALALEPESITGVALRLGFYGMLGGGFFGGLIGVLAAAREWPAGTGTRVAVMVPPLMAGALLLVGWLVQR